MSLPPNVVVRQILVTDLSQQIKKQRDFMRWMVRKYTKLEQPEVAGAFSKGAEILEELRDDLVAGLFDLEEKEVFTREPAEVTAARAEKDLEVGRQLLVEDNIRQLKEMAEDPRWQIPATSPGFVSLAKTD